MILRGTDNVYLQSGTTDETFFKGTVNGAAELYYDNSKKFETTSNGVKITGGLQDGDGDLGTSGQVLSSTGTVLNWVDPDSGSRVFRVLRVPLVILDPQVLRVPLVLKVLQVVMVAMVATDPTVLRELRDLRVLMVVTVLQVLRVHKVFRVLRVPLVILDPQVLLVLRVLRVLQVVMVLMVAMVLTVLETTSQGEQGPAGGSTGTNYNDNVKVQFGNSNDADFS